MPKTTLEILSERREPIVLLDASGRITTLGKITKDTYSEIDTFDSIAMYAEAVPADTAESYLELVDEKALLDHTPHYYETNKYNHLLALIGYIGVELCLRYTANGARFSTLKPGVDKLHTDERFLAVSPSIYFAVNDADGVLNERLRTELKDESW